MAAAKPPDLVVIMPVKDWVCARCTGTGDLLTMDDAGPLCMTCADLDHLVFLGAGDAALTRRAKKASVLSAVVVRGVAAASGTSGRASWSRKQHSNRPNRSASPTRTWNSRRAWWPKSRGCFPRCPPERAEAIARHTALRGSGRVGRSAAGRALDEQSITLAVVASVRHQDTDYDSLLMSGVPRDLARDRIRPDIARVLVSWA